MDYWSQVARNLEIVSNSRAVATDYSQHVQDQNEQWEWRNRQTRQQILFEFSEKIKGIHEVYQSNPAQALYDALWLRDDFQNENFQGIDFPELEWKTFLSTVTQDLEALVNHGSKIDEESRFAAINLFNKEVTQIVEERKNHDRAMQLAENARVWSVAGLIITGCCIVGLIKGIRALKLYSKCRSKKGRGSAEAAITLGVVGLLMNIIGLTFAFKDILMSN